MKQLKIYLFLAIGLLTIAGCQKDEIEIFDVTSPGLVFPGAGDARDYKGYNSGDKTYYINESFLNVPLAQNTYTIDFPVKISGIVADKNRVVNYRIIEDETTALSSQYEITEAVIPAGEQYGYIRFVLSRDEALDSLSVNVAIELIESEDLKVGSNEYRKGILNWSNMLPMFPATANHRRTYSMMILSPLGRTSTSAAYYSTNAHKAILDTFGWEIDYWPGYNNGREDPGTGTTTILGVYYTDLYARKLQKFLDDYAAANGGVRLKHNEGDGKGIAIQARVNGVVYDPNL